MTSFSVDPKQGFAVKKVKLDISKGNIVSNAGLRTIMELFDKSPLSKEFAKCLPERKSHLPCFSFKANHAFLLLLTAANMLRWVSLITKPDKPLYAKKLRRKFIFQAGRLVSHARQLTLKVSKKFKEEVDRLREAWEAKPIITFPQYSSA